MEKVKYISIGQMAKMKHTTVATLRHYDEKDLLKPIYVDPESNYRYYSVKQMYRLDMIQYMKELGMSLSEIQLVFKKNDIRLIEEILSIKNEQMHREIKELKARHDAVERAIQSIERYCNSPAKGVITLEYIDRRLVWGIPCMNNFYEDGIEAYELELNKFRKKMHDLGVSEVHSYNALTTIDKDNYLNDAYIPKELLVEVTKHFEISENVRKIDASMYACIYLDSFDYEIKYGKILKEYCIEHGYIITGDYICEVMTEFNVFDDEQHSMYLRLQVPIAFEKTSLDSHVR